VFRSHGPDGWPVDKDEPDPGRHRRTSWSGNEVAHMIAADEGDRLIAGVFGLTSSVMTLPLSKVESSAANVMTPVTVLKESTC
jgi:hypothetical protein